MHLFIAQMVSFSPFETTKQYEDYLARLGKLPTLIDQIIEVLHQGEKDKLMPPRFLLDKTIEQCKSIADPVGEMSPVRPAVVAFSRPRDQRGSYFA